MSIELNRRERKKVSEEVWLINKLFGVYDVDELIEESLKRIEDIIKNK